MWKANGTGSSSYLEDLHKFLLYGLSKPNTVLTFVFNLFTNASRASRERFAGKFTAGASGSPSSSETNCTTTFGVGFGGSFSGSGTPWYTFCLFGGGNKVAIAR